MKRVSLNLYYGCIKEDESYFLSEDENIRDHMFLMFSGERDWKGLFEMLPVPKKDDMYIVNITSDFSDELDKFNNKLINKVSINQEWDSEVTRKFYSLEMNDNQGFIIDSQVIPFYKKKYGKVEYDCSRTHGEAFELKDYLVNICPVNKERDKNGLPVYCEFTMTVRTKKIK